MKVLTHLRIPMHNHHALGTPCRKRRRLLHHRRDSRRHAGAVVVAARRGVLDRLGRGVARPREGPREEFDERNGGAEAGRGGRLAGGDDMDFRARGLFLLGWLGLGLGLR